MESKPDQVDAKKRGSRKKKWIIGSVIIMIVLGILGTTMANTIIAKVAPDKYVLLSILEMKKIGMEKENNSNLLYPKNRKVDLNLNLSEIDGVYDDHYKEIIEGSGISLSVSNSQARDVFLDVGFNKNGTSLMDLSFYNSSHQFGFKIPGLLDQYAIIDLKQFKQKYDGSDLSHYMGNIEQEYVDLFNMYLTQIRNAISGNIMGANPQFNADVEELVIALAKSAKVQHIGPTKVTIDNKTKNANQFSITLNSGDVKNFIQSIAKTTIKNTHMANTFLAYENYYTQEDLKEIISEGINQIKFSDIEITCAIDYKKRIINTEITTALDADGDTIKVNSAYILSGGESIFDKVEANLKLESEYEKIQFSLERDLKAKEDNFAFTSNIIMDEDSKINFKVSGDLLVNKATHLASLDANKIELKVEDYGDTFSVLGSGSFKVDDLKDQIITIPESQQLDLFSMGSGQILDIMGRLGAQFYGMGGYIELYLLNQKG